MKEKKILLPKDPSNAKTPWLWIGTWSMGGEGFGGHDEKESLKVLNYAVENGIRHFDTAGFYAHGRSEELLQKIIKGQREEFFISTKGGLVWDGRRVEHRASPGELEKQLHKSLEVLKTDYLDLYQLHWPDPEVPIRESIGALKELQGRGLMRYWGIGNFDVKQIKNNLMKEKDIPHQVHFNPVHRSHNVLIEGKDRCINCIISPLEQGLLGSGNGSKGGDGIGRKDIRNRNPCFSNKEVLAWNNKIDDLVKDEKISKVSLILMWICSQPHVNAIIPGPRKVNQLLELLRFKVEIEKKELISACKSDSILSSERVKAMIPVRVRAHLDEGPVGR